MATKNKKKKVAKKVVSFSPNTAAEPTEWQKQEKKRKELREAVLKQANILFPPAFAEMEKLAKQIINAKSFDRKLELDTKLGNVELDLLAKIASKFDEKEVRGTKYTKKEMDAPDFFDNRPIIDYQSLREMIFDFGEINGKKAQINDLNNKVNFHIYSVKKKAVKEKKKVYEGKKAVLKKDLSFGAKSDTNSYGITFPKGAVGTIMSVKDTSEFVYTRSLHPNYQFKVFVPVNTNYGHHFWASIKDVTVK